MGRFLLLKVSYNSHDFLSRPIKKNRNYVDISTEMFNKVKIVDYINYLHKYVFKFSFKVQKYRPIPKE